jgi:hypothetical protein
MATFRQYNIQLLPLNTKTTNEVGKDGYKKLFELLKKETTTAYQNKEMAEKAKALLNDSYICPFLVHIENDFSYGKFLKYHMAETVTEFYSQERLFEAPAGTTAVSNQVLFRFVFDYEFHRFAIEEISGKLPGVEIMLKTLKHFLDNIAQVNFPNHVLEMNLISDAERLKDVFSRGE